MKVKAAFYKQNRLLWFAGAAAFAVALIAMMPASIAAAMIRAQAPLVEIGAANGTIWNGVFEGVRYDVINLGDVRYRLSPVMLIAGKFSGEASASGGALNAKGDFALSGSGLSFENAIADFNLGAIRRYSFFGVPYQGVASFSAKSLRLSKTKCEAEGAIVATDMFDSVARRWNFSALPLEGTITCRDGNLVVAMSGNNADGAMLAEAVIDSALAYRLDFRVTTKRREIDTALRQIGFEEDGGKLSLQAAGRLKGLNS